MLFSFALIATLLTIVNVGVNETNPTAALSTVAKAHAINYDGSVGTPVPIPSANACSGAACGPNKGAGVGTVGGAVIPPNQKTIYYGCSSVDGAGNCNVGPIVQRDALVRSEWCSMSLSQNGQIIASSGNMAVRIMKQKLLGTIWSPWGDEEAMYSFLTGYDLGWFIYPIGWSEVNNGYYNGTTNSYSNGAYSFFCQKQIKVDPPIYTTNSTVCVPKNDGRPFPYATGYVVTYKNVNTDIVGFQKNRDWQAISQSCVYVSSSTPPPKYADALVTCYWNIQHYGYFSTNRAAILSGGTPTTNRPVSPNQGALQPYISGNNSTANLNRCTQVIDMSADLSLKDGYAYYRLQGQANFQKFQFYVWDTRYTGGRKLLADISSTGSGVTSKLVYGTHTCQNNPPYRQYPSWGSLPNLTFKASDCGRGPEWTCKIPYAPRITGVTNPVEVMRDGNYLRTDLGGVNVSGRGIRDTTTKQVSTVADNNMSYMVSVVNGSSPFNGTNANDSKQYFELWKGDKSTETLWNTWVNQPNANRTSYLTYYWSSDNGTKWNMTYKAKLNTADFGVPFQDSSKSAPYTKWITETNVDCDGTLTSNSATVLRSVTSEG